MNNTIAAIATPYAVGGISIIRISGDKAFLIAKKVFSPISNKNVEKMNGYSAAFGNIIDSSNNEIDQGILTVFNSPNSYTGEDVVEISCHGGLFITQKVLSIILLAGATLASAGEFTKRAFLNGKMDLIHAEAVAELINSNSEQSLKMALSQLNGTLNKNINKIKQSLLDTIAHLSVWADYPEEDILEISNEKLLNNLIDIANTLKKLLDNFHQGSIIKEGITTAIIGKPNVGKSTLMNLLAGNNKSIVTTIAGTTRDVIEDTVRIGEITLKLADTAGIRQTEDIVESFGVDMAINRIKTAELILLVLDNSQQLSDEDKHIIEKIENTPVIVVVNKSDLERKIDLEDKYLSHFKNIVFISANNTNDVTLLEDEINKVFSLYNFDTSAGVILNERQKQCVNLCYENVITAVNILKQNVTLDALTVVLEEALEHLLSLFGESVTTSVVGEIFSKFCVGK